MREELKKQLYSIKLPSIPEKATYMNNNDPDHI